MAEVEDWRPVVGFEELYEVSDLGRIKNARTGRILRLRLDKDGYQLVSVYRGRPAKKHDLKVHRVVLSAFIGEPAVGMQSNHENGDRADNRLFNLRWVTCSENHLHAFGALKRSTPWAKPVTATREGHSLSFPSVAWAGRSGFNRKAIHEVLSGKRKTHRGYHWRYT